jgi:hypothetical protein
VALDVEDAQERNVPPAPPRPILIAGTEEFRGEAPDAALGDRLAKLVQRQASPQRTTVTASNYRRQVAADLARRLLAELATGGARANAS